MEMFALDDEITRLETTLADSLRLYMNSNNQLNSSLANAHHLSFSQLQNLVCLAWYLRQSNTERALLLAEIAELALARQVADAKHLLSMQARVLLIRAESHWLVSRYDLAHQLASEAGALFQIHDDALGLADMHWLMGNIELDRGDAPRRQVEREKASEQALRAGDMTRQVIVNISLGVEAMMRNYKTAMEYWPQQLPSLELGEEELSPCARTWVYDFWGMAASVRSDFGQAAQYWVQTHAYALRTGQHKRAVISATNVGDAFNCLSEHQGALDWMERGLDLARRHNWPNSIALCQFQTAETMRRLGRLETAEELLQHALQTLEEFNVSRNYVNALSCLAELRLSQHDWQGALVYFQQLQQSADFLSHADFQIIALRGQAHALAYLGQIQQAYAFALKSLEGAQQAHNTYSQIDALRVLAEVHGMPDAASLPQPTKMQGKTARMHFLLQALQLSNSIEGNLVDAQLLTDLAREYAQYQDFENAWRCADEAANMREKTHNQEATHRAIAMQIQYQSIQTRAENEKAQADIAHHRQMAALEAQRAEGLQKNSETLERLSVIGQEITAELEISSVFEVLNRHVHGLLDVTTFIILLLSEDGQRLEHAFSRERGLSLQVKPLEIASAQADSVYCLRNHREVLRDYGPDDATPNLIPDSLHTLTALYAPLAIGDQVLGVMSIQSLQRFAYGERERLIFRTLCAYGAIALDNAHAYRQLQQAQNHLVAQEKLAALGAMVAGVAHELNTPLGNCLMIASALQEKTNLMAGRINGPSLHRVHLQEFMDDVEQACAVLMRGLSSAGDLVASFKQVAVDRTTAQRRRFELQQTCHEITSTLMNQVKISGHQLTLDIPPDIWLESYPGPLGQVITNLINNALLHAFEDRKLGHMHLSAQLLPNERVEIRFKDDGVGISEHNLHHIFDPFFTTKMGQGGTGLGLSISFNIVTSLLGGQLSVTSTLEKGSCFILDLPLQATAPPL